MRRETKMSRSQNLLLHLIVLSIPSCAAPTPTIDGGRAPDSLPETTATGVPTSASEVTVAAPPTVPEAPSTPPSGDVVQAADLIYLGAFRLPGGDTPPQTFAYGGNAMTFRPGGDPGGPDDGYPGSLFVMGHDRQAWGGLPDGMTPEPVLMEALSPPEPGGLAELFAQPLNDPPDNAFSYLMQYDVLAIKSCYPVSLIESAEQLAAYQGYYLGMRDRMDQLSGKLFIVVTEPPETPNDTDRATAARARPMASWLASDEFLDGHPNVVTFDFFDLLADPATDMLRPEYRTSESDAHPNGLANRTIGPLFVESVDRAIRSFIGR